jgi:hypothetical protein
MSQLKFEFSDLIAGYVTRFDKAKRKFTLRTSDGREFEAGIAGNCYAKIMRNLGEPYMDCTGQIDDLLQSEQFLFAYGIFYPENNSHTFEAYEINFPGRKKGKYRFEEPDWWVKQARSICDFFIRAQFGGPENIDYKNYRTLIDLSGGKVGTTRQETDTISRMIYGMASTFLLTGEDRFLEAAEKGTKYLRDHMRFYDTDENVAYWYHGIDIKEDGEHKVFAS